METGAAFPDNTTRLDTTTPWWAVFLGLGLQVVRGAGAGSGVILCGTGFKLVMLEDPQRFLVGALLIPCGVALFYSSIRPTRRLSALSTRFHHAYHTTLQNGGFSWGLWSAVASVNVLRACVLCLGLVMSFALVWFPTSPLLGADLASQISHGLVPYYFYLAVWLWVVGISLCPSRPTLALLPVILSLGLVATLMWHPTWHPSEPPWILSLLFYSAVLIAIDPWRWLPGWLRCVALLVGVGLWGLSRMYRWYISWTMAIYHVLPFVLFLPERLHQIFFWVLTVIFWGYVYKLLHLCVRGEGVMGTFKRLYEQYVMGRRIGAWLEWWEDLKPSTVSETQGARTATEDEIDRLRRRE